MITKSWLAGGVSTANREGRTLLSPSRSSDPIAVLRSNRSPYSAMNTRALSYRTVGWTDESIAAVRWAADGTMSHAVSASSIISPCTVAGSPPDSSCSWLRRW